MANNTKTKIFERLNLCIQNRNLPQTILLYGPSLSELDDIVYGIALNLIVPKRFFEKERFATLCSSKQYPDFINVVKGDSGSIKIDEIHEIEAVIQYLPYESENRIVYFRDAAAVNLQAQNAILKKIEEPPSRTFFFLAVNKKNSLLPTILSRSVSIFVPASNLDSSPLTPEDYYHFLTDLIPEFGVEIFLAEKKLVEMAASEFNMRSMININEIYDLLSKSDNYDKTAFGDLSKEKSDYLKKMLVKMRLALLSFYLKNDFPALSKKIAIFLDNWQSFSTDGSIFYNLIGDEIG